MKKGKRKGTGTPSVFSSQTPETKQNNMKEEISLELAEIGNLNPKHEPMTPNQRQKGESEKTYK